MPPPGPRVLWTPPPDVRETTEIGRYLAWLEHERGLAFPDYDELQRWSVDRSARVLVLDLGVLRGQGACAVQHGARLRGDAGRALVPGRPPELRRAPARRRGGRRANRRRLALADARAGRPDLCGAPRAGRAGACRPRAPRRRAGRPGRGLPAEHPGDARRVRRRRRASGGLGELCTRARGAQRRRPAGAARAVGAPGRRRLRLPRPHCRPPRRGGDYPGRPPHPAARRARALRQARRAGRRRLGRAARRAGPAARLRARRVRPPAVRALLVGDDRAPEGDRARPRRHPAGAAQGTCASAGT